MDKRSPDKSRPRVLDELGANFRQALDGLSEEAGARHDARGPAPRRKFSALGIAGFAVALAIGTVILFLTESTELNAGRALAAIAQAANEIPRPSPTDFTYTKAETSSVQGRVSDPGSAESSAPTSWVTIHETRESWLSVSRTGLVRTVAESVSAPGNHNAPGRVTSVDRQPVNFSYPPFRKYQIGDRAYSYVDLERLARTPEKLIAQMDADVQKHNPSDRATAKWSALSQPLEATAPPLPPEIRAALIRSLGTVTGAETLGHVADPQDRVGDGFRLDAHGVRQLLIFDPRTSALIYSSSTVEDGTIAAERGVPIGTILQSFALIESGITSKLP